MKKPLKLLMIACAAVLIFGVAVVALAVPRLQSITVLLQPLYDESDLVFYLGNAALNDAPSQNPDDYIVFDIRTDFRHALYGRHARRGLAVSHSQRVVAENVGMVGEKTVLYIAGLSESEIEEYMRNLYVTFRLQSRFGLLRIFTQTPRTESLDEARFEIITR
ncbi:MAG: hypothetical protein FWE40_03680 [Oscillospiraceae bacterium]|nr:hypothetical protein [Oscillospiraceae bacterium]